MDMPEGRKRPVVEGSITDEFKRHEVILSYSSEMYDTDDPEMISGAEVYVRIGSDTIWFYEQDNKPGHYLSDSVSGRRNRAHHLEINVKENTLYSRPIRMYADTKMSNNARGIDSVGLLPLRNEEGLPFVDDEAAVCVCPYFQTLSDASIVYNVELYLNGRRFKNRPSKLFNLTVSIVCGQRLHDFNCGIKAYRSSVVRFIHLYGDYHRFIPVMAKWQGFRITEMPVAHRARVHGVSKYGVSRLVSGFLDLVSLMFMRSFASKPLHFFGLLGLIFMLIGFGVSGYFGYEWLQTGALHVRPLLLAGGFSLVMGVQFMSLGLLGEMMNGSKKQSYPVAESIREIVDLG